MKTGQAIFMFGLRILGFENEKDLIENLFLKSIIDSMQSISSKIK
jgi:hypothetical protein